MTVLVWDVSDILPAMAWPPALSQAEMEELWKDLRNEDAARAYRSMQRLAAAPRQALVFLGAHLQPVPPLRTADLVAALNSDQFKVRTGAFHKLELLGDAAVQAALHRRPSLEVRQRLELFLNSLQAPTPQTARAGEETKAAAPKGLLPSGRVPPPEQLRVLRALEILEQIGSPDARQVLATLAGGTPRARITEEAKACLKRLQTHGTK